MQNEEDEIFNSAWPELEINNSHAECNMFIWATAYGGIKYFWSLDDNDFGQLIASDRTFETRGQALDDALDFIQYHVIPYGYPEEE